jgi:hypothetical protein
MTNRFTTLAAAAFCLSLSAPASAGDFRPVTTVGGWSITADESTCIAKGQYDNGTSLAFVINASGQASISIENLKWRIPEGDYEVLVQVDRSAANRFKAAATGPWVFFNIQLVEHNINLLSQGRKLFVTVGQWVYEYQLVGSAAMLRGLGECAGQRMAAAPNPFAGAESIPASSNPFAGN